MFAYPTVRQSIGVSLFSAAKVLGFAAAVEGAGLVGAKRIAALNAVSALPL